MNNLFIISTPFHLFCALNIACSEYVGDKNSFLIEGVGLHAFSSSLGLVAKEIGGEVIEVRNEAGKINKARDFASLLSKRAFSHSSKYSIFERVVVFSPSLLSAAVRQSNPSAEFVLAEDGSGTYSGLILSRRAYFDSCESNSDLWSNFCRLYFKDTLYLRPEKVLVFCPELVDYRYSCPILPIRFSEAAISLFLIALGLVEDAELSLEGKIVFLGQCYPEIGLSDSDIVELKELERYSDEVLFRRHPRSKLSPSCFNLHSSKSWEVSSKTLSNSSVLVSIGSSAMLTPKMIYGVEPFLVFTHRLHPKMDKSFYASFEDLYARAKALYQGVGKVFAPSSLDEYRCLMQKTREWGLDCEGEK